MSHQPEHNSVISQANKIVPLRAKFVGFVLVPNSSVLVASWPLKEAFTTICRSNEYELRRYAQIVFENIYRAKAQRSMSRRAAFWFFATFRAGNTNSKEQLRSEHPREVDREAVAEATEGDPTLAIVELADDFHCGNATVSRMLNAAGKKWNKVALVSKLMRKLIKLQQHVFLVAPSISAIVLIFQALIFVSYKETLFIVNNDSERHWYGMAQGSGGRAGGKVTISIELDIRRQKKGSLLFDKLL
ncbi:hypothetical protein KIN20_016664 [Parelaphostrongylus tenuis]|uniref:Uncharacterized protein n=1 Tax=Parelaphostrongylus tenuis TaxID=148309 RepID=A0AAD5QTB3_PARTN|nr:hypothetical protein KIN20_016664 [Parelaphostrongylus tenuis]